VAEALLNKESQTVCPSVAKLFALSKIFLEPPAGPWPIVKVHFRCCDRLLPNSARYKYRYSLNVWFPIDVHVTCAHSSVTMIQGPWPRQSQAATYCIQVNHFLLYGLLGVDENNDLGKKRH
jgi:hypothetical protein